MKAATPLSYFLFGNFWRSKPFHKNKVISYGIGYNNTPSKLSWIDSGGVMKVEQISTLDGTIFHDKVKHLFIFWKSFFLVPKLPLSAW